MATTIDAAGVPALTEAERRYFAAKRRALWRRRLLPFVGALTLLAIWAGLVYFLEVPRLMAQSARLVSPRLSGRFGILMTNLLPTAIEAVSGFLLGNVVAIVIATVFVHQKAVEEAFFPMVVLINTIPVVAKAPILVLLMGNGMEPK